MKRLLLILTVFILTGFANVYRQDTGEQKFKIEISYIGLPSPVTIKYFIDNKNIVAYKTIYNNEKGAFVDLSKSTFEKFDRKIFIAFLYRIKWTEIPSKITTPNIDGFHYTVDIMFNGKSFHYDIDNAYNPTMDSLFTICNNSIPSRKKRDEYFLPIAK